MLSRTVAIFIASSRQCLVYRSVFVDVYQIFDFFIFKIGQQCCCCYYCFWRGTDCCSVGYACYQRLQWVMFADNKKHTHTYAHTKRTQKAQKPIKYKITTTTSATWRWIAFNSLRSLHCNLLPLVVVLFYCLLFLIFWFFSFLKTLLDSLAKESVCYV